MPHKSRIGLGGAPVFLKVDFQRVPPGADLSWVGGLDIGYVDDNGMKWSMSGKGDFFAQTRWWLTPYVGVLVRRQPG